MFKLGCEWGVSESSLEMALLFVLGTDVLLTIRESIITHNCISEELSVSWSG